MPQQKQYPNTAAVLAAKSNSVNNQRSKDVFSSAHSITGAAGMTGAIGPVPASKHDKLLRLSNSISWFNEFIAMLDDIIEKRELSIDQLECVPGFAKDLPYVVTFGGKDKLFEGFKNSFWRCIHRVDSLIFQDYEYIKQLRQILCEARQMLHPDVGKTWAEIAKEEATQEDERYCREDTVVAANTYSKEKIQKLQKLRDALQEKGF